MRKIYQLSVAALALLTALTITSCTTSEDVTADSSGQGSDAAPKIVFNIKTPLGDPLVYTRGIADTDAEAKLKSLWLYEIDAATDKIVSAPVDLIGTSDPRFTNNIDGSTITDMNATYTLTEDVARTLTAENQLSRRFVFVANDQPINPTTSAAFVANDNYSDLVQAIATQAYKNPTELAAVPADDQSTNDIWNTIDATEVLPMSGDAVAGGSKVIPIEKETKVINTTVELTRAVARIDVVNLTPQLIITGMRLMKSNTRGYLIPQMGADQKTPTYAYPTTAAGASANAEEASDILVSNNATTENYGTVNAVQVFTPILGADGNVQKNVSGEFVGAKRSMAFYIYEGTPASYVTDNEETAMHLQVYGTLFDGVPVYYNIPFTAKYNKDLLPTDVEYAANQPVVIKRNNIYTVEIGDGYKTSATTDVKLSFSIANWNVQKMKENIDTEIFKYSDPNDVDPDDPSDNYASTETGRDPYEKANYVINIPATSNAAINPLKIYVSEDYENVQIKKVEISKGTGWTTGITADDATETYNWLKTTLKADASSNSGKIVELVAAAVPALPNPAKRDLSFRITYDINDPDNPGSTLSAGLTQVFTVRQDAGDKLVFVNNGTAADDGVYSYEDEVQYITFGKYGNTNAFTININDNAATPVTYTDITDISVDGSSLLTADGTAASDWLSVTMASTSTVSLTAAANTINSAARQKTLTITYGSGKTVTFVVKQERGDRLVLTNDGTTGDATNGTFTLTAGTNTGTIDFTAAANVNPYIIAVKDQTISNVTSSETWATATLNNGKVSLSVTANDSGAARTATVTITYGDSKTVTFTVNQPAA